MLYYHWLIKKVLWPIAEQSGWKRYRERVGGVKETPRKKTPELVGLVEIHRIIEMG